ncbi:bifunctional 2-polyprenyl-6-hydroxyphenol methylase/3-demethylubiquinol 3-O-methyltransferase UbiG [Microbacterium sp. SS28]|uniref:class I SAM-dependent methyltransferase n=1 Tax=Microbacterium sp. SS28 TaxID=2919948 RepID=UPI001FAAC790|nr:class I SAM-dependent methyltransferase [Microbacterium sp. SS28]
MHSESGAGLTPSVFWEERYSSADRVWSGTANRTFVDVVSPLAPGLALDLGCGEGADVIWMAEHGWQATGIDISSTAVARAREAASARGLADGRATFEAADLATWRSATEYDLITASFLQSPVALPRAEILREVAASVAPGGHLLVIGHAAPPPWSAHRDHHANLPTPEDEVAALALDEGEWMLRLAETRPRESLGPDGTPAVLDDTVVLMRRRG